MRPVEITDADIGYHNKDELAYIQFTCLRSGKLDYRTICLNSMDQRKKMLGNSELTLLIAASGITDIRGIEQLIGSKVIMWRRRDGTASYERYICDDLARQHFEKRAAE